MTEQSNFLKGCKSSTEPDRDEVSITMITDQLNIVQKEGQFCEGHEGQNNQESQEQDHDNYIFIKFKNDKDDNEEIDPAKDKEQPAASGSSSPGTRNLEPIDPDSYSDDDDGDLAFFHDLFHDEDFGIDEYEYALGLTDEHPLREMFRDGDDESLFLHILREQGIFGLHTLPSHLQEEISEPVYPRSKKEKGTCDICFNEDIDTRKRLCCQAPVCETCLTEYLKNGVNQRILTLRCVSCDSYVHRDEILDLLPKDMKLKYYRYLVEENKDPNIKTCPRCCVLQKKSDISHEPDSSPKRKSKKSDTGLKVTCSKCALVWCFDCQAPYHQNIKCKEYRKGDKLVKNWAKEINYGQKNAVQCPKCKVFIQKKSGCSHMTCKNCNTSFCYRCGRRYIQMKLLGKHSDRFSPFGCKYNLLPDRPYARKAVRGGIMCGRIIGGVGLGALIIGAAAIFIGGSVIFVPTYFGMKYYNRRKQKKLFKNYRQAREKAKEIRKNEVKELPNEEILSSTELGTNSDTMTSTESSSSNDHHRSTEVKVWVHSEIDDRPVEVVHYKSQEQQTTNSINDNTVTTAEVTMENDLVVLHVKTTSKNSEGEVTPYKQEVDGSIIQKPRELPVEVNVDKTKVNDKIDMKGDTQGCFVKILAKLPVKCEKDDEMKDAIPSKPALVKEKKRKLGTRRAKSIDIPESEKTDSYIQGMNSDIDDEAKISEIKSALKICDKTGSYNGSVAMETFV